MHSQYTSAAVYEGLGTRLTVAEAERSFSVLKRIKNYLRSTMCQMRLTSLETLAVESELAKH